MTIFSASCADDLDDRLAQAGQTIGETRAETASRPALPEDCRDHTLIRPALGERLDDLVIRYAWALSEEHARTDRCAAWHDKVFGGD